MTEPTEAHWLEGLDGQSEHDYFVQDDLNLRVCPYYRLYHGDPNPGEGAHGPGTCMGGCHDEPACVTDEPLEGWPPVRVLAPGQWLGTMNRITRVRRTRSGWEAVDSTTATYSSEDHPDGLKTWDEPTPGGTPSPPTPWPTQ